MERHLSTGTATIVALMAAHRDAASRQNGARPGFAQALVAGIEAALRRAATPDRVERAALSTCDRLRTAQWQAMEAARRTDGPASKEVR